MTRLAEREQQIAIRVAEGKKNSEIGKELHLKTSTVKQYLRTIMRKVGVRNRVELAILVIEQGGLPGAKLPALVTVSLAAAKLVLPILAIAASNSTS